MSAGQAGQGPGEGRIWTADGAVVVPPPQRLRLMSYNIHVGSRPGHYGHYVTRAWRHLLPGPGMHATLDRMAEMMQGHDFVAVQEADAGSLRTRFVNQLEYLAKRAGFSHLGFTITRDLKPIARHALGFLSRVAPRATAEHALPSRIPGRRAMTVELGPDGHGLNLVIAHLSLGHFDRHQQLDYLSGLVKPERPTVLLGDLNCEPDILRAHVALSGCGFRVPDETPPTFPSWRPKLRLDHILATKHVTVSRLEALPNLLSDHLALAAEIAIP